MIQSINSWILLNVLMNFYSLPYVEATIRENLRFDTLIPSGLPHTALADTTFNGYSVPKVSEASILI